MIINMTFTVPNNYTLSFIDTVAISSYNFKVVRHEYNTDIVIVIEEDRFSDVIEAVKSFGEALEIVVEHGKFGGITKAGRVTLDE